MKSHVVVDGVWSPNGIVFRAASTSLLVAETRRNLIAEYPVLEPGKVGPRSVVAKLPDSDKWDYVGPDGIALDESGNLYVAHYGTGQVRVLNTKGELTRSLPVGHEGVTNLAFGGPNRSELYVTGSVAAFAGDSPGVVNLLPLDDVRGLQLIPDGTCQQLWDTRELHLVSLDYGGETREVGAIDVNIDQDLVA